MKVSQLIILVVFSLSTTRGNAANTRVIDVQLANGVASVEDALFVGGMNGGRIVRISSGGESQTVTEGHPRVRSVAALRLDPATGLLWGTAPDLFGQAGPDGSIVRARSVVFVIDPATDEYSRLVDWPAGTFTNDVAIGADGTVFVTDSLGGRVWRLSPGAERPAVHVERALLGGEGLGAAGIAIADDGTLFVGTYTAGRLLRIRGDEVQPLRLSMPIRNPDGIRILSNGDLVVLEGDAHGESGRVLRLKLHGLDAAVTVIAEIDMPLNLTLDGNTAVVTDAAARPWLRAFLAGDRINPPAKSRLVRVPLEKDEP